MNQDANRGARQLALILAVFFSPLAGATPVDDFLKDAEIALAASDLDKAATAFVAAAEASPDAAVAERASQFTFGTGFDAEAERAVTRWTVLAPENPLPRELLGRLKLRRHAVDEAVPDLLAALGPGEPRRDEVYLALAADLANESDAALVTRALARLTAQDPLAPGLQLALGTAALRSGDYDLALAAADSAALGSPDYPEPALLRARALAASGRVEQGLAVVKGLRALEPESLVDIEYARLLADAGRVAEARAQLDEMATRFGGRPEIARTRAFIDLAAGALDEADARFASLEAAGTERFECFYYRGQIAASRGNADEARRLFARISSGTYLVPAQLAIAESLVRADQSDQALDHLGRFAADHPADAFRVLDYRAQVLQFLKRPDDALAVYDAALRYKPTAVPLLLARGALLEQEGRVADALVDLELATRIAPDDATAANAYGYILANRTRDARKAWLHVRRAWELQPDSAAIEDSVGWTLFKLGRTDEARDHLEAALSRLQDPEIASHLADVLWTLGDRDEATGLLRAAATAFPDSAPVRSTAERLLLR